MHHRNPLLIKEELKDVRELISLNQELISNYPDKKDAAIEFNLSFLEEREKELLDELNKSYEDRNVDTFDIVIDKENPPLDEVLDIGHSTQELFRPLAYAYGNRAVNRGDKIPQDIINATTLGLREAKVGSLRLSLIIDPLKTDDQKRFVTLIETAIDNLNTLISCGTDKELIKRQTKILGTQCIDKYKDFVEVVSKQKTDLLLFDEEKPKGFKTQKITNDFAESVYQVIVETQEPKEEKIEIEGRLGVIDTFSHKFQIKDSKNKRIYVNFDEHFTEQIKERLEQIVRVELNVTKTYHEIEDKTDKKLELKRFLD